MEEMYSHNILRHARLKIYVEWNMKLELVEA